MKKTIKVIKPFLTLFLTLLLINCQKDDNLPAEEINTQKESLRMTMTSWEHLSHENSALTETVSGLFQQSTQRTLTSEEYGFYLNENSVQVIEHENFTTYTFLIYRDGYTPNEVENYVYKEFSDGSNQQYILTYKYTVNSTGDIVYDTDYLHLLPIEDANLVSTNRGVGGCLPYFEESEEEVCAPSQFCFGLNSAGTHEDASNCECQVTYMTCFPPGTELCEMQTIYTLVTNCGGSNDIPDDDNDGGSGGTGNGSNDNDDTDEDEEEEEDTDSSTDETPAILLNYTKPLIQLINSLPLSMQSHINALENHILKQKLQAFYNSNEANIENNKLAADIIEASFDGSIVNAFPFVKYPTALAQQYKDAYPNFTEFLVNELINIKNDQNVMDAITQLGTLTEAQVVNALTWGQGPEVRFSSLSSDNSMLGKYNPTPIGADGADFGPNVIEINTYFAQAYEDLVNGINPQYDLKAFKFFIAIVIMHELTHYADYTYAGHVFFQENVETGYLFEDEVFNDLIVDGQEFEVTIDTFEEIIQQYFLIKD